MLCLVPLLNMGVYLVYTGLCRIAHSAEYGEELSEEPVSVIITAHNMAEHLKRNLPLILEQHYSNFEVVVVNDASTDDTEDVLTLLERKYKNLYHTFTPENAKYMSHKKLALTLAVRAAKNEWLVFTEANCVPASENWLKSLSRNFTADTNIVIGYANYAFDEDCSRFCRKIIFDRLYTQMYRLRQAYAYRAVEATGCNLAYRKSFFLSKKGFSNHLDLLKGSSELFVNNYAEYKEGTRVELSPDSFVVQAVPEPHRLWKEDKVFYRETCRHFKHRFNAFALYKWNSFVNYLAWGAFGLAIAFYLNVNIIPAIQYSQWGLVALLGLLFVGWQVMKITMFRRVTRYFGTPSYGLSLLWYELSIPLRNMLFYLKYRSMDRRDFMRR